MAVVASAFEVWHSMNWGTLLHTHPKLFPHRFCVCTAAAIAVSCLLTKQLSKQFIYKYIVTIFCWFFCYFVASIGSFDLSILLPLTLYERCIFCSYTNLWPWTWIIKTHTHATTAAKPMNSFYIYMKKKTSLNFIICSVSFFLICMIFLSFLYCM